MPCAGNGDLSDEDEFEELPLESLPLDAWHRAHGARMVPFAGYEMPIQYTGPFGGIVAEHEWTRSHAGLFDVSHMGQLILSGPDVAAELEKLLPGDIIGLKPGQMRYSLLLDENGGILDDLIVTNEGDQLAIVVNGAVKWDDIGHLREYLPDDISLNHSADYGLLALQGPEAATALARLVPDAAGLVFMQAMPAEWRGHAIGISRSGYTGEDGFEISLPNEALADFADALCAMDEVRPIGLGARDSLRLEAGLPLYGHDLSPETDPVSAGLAFAISKRRRAEGGFPGAGRILELLSAGPATRRVGLALDGRLPAREGAQVFAGERNVGTVTSGGFSPTLGHPIAMAYVAADHAAAGTALEIEVRGKRLAARVTPMPFVPHRYFRGS